MKKIILFSLSLLSLLTACDDSKSYLPNVTGSTFDLLVVAPSASKDDTCSRMVRDVFTDPVPGLPEYEPMFKVIPVPRALFDAQLKPTRNILFYDIDKSKYTKGTLRLERDKWAKTQAVAYLTAPDTASFLQLVDSTKNSICRFYNSAEEDRFLYFFDKYRNSTGMNQVKSMFGVEMLIPSHLDKSKIGGKDFIWFSNANVDFTESMMVFSHPYHSKADFAPEKILAVQDSFTKLYVPGPSEGSFMSTSHKVETVAEVVKSRDSEYCLEICGLWHCEKDVMGGPFVSRSFLSADHKSIITGVAFLYGPGHDKKVKLRMLEAALSTTSVKGTEVESTSKEK